MRDRRQYNFPHFSLKIIHHVNNYDIMVSVWRDGEKDTKMSGRRVKQELG